MDKIIWVKTGEDDEYIYGKRMQGDVKITDTMQVKPGYNFFNEKNHWENIRKIGEELEKKRSEYWKNKIA